MCRTISLKRLREPRPGQARPAGRESGRPEFRCIGLDHATRRIGEIPVILTTTMTKRLSVCSSLHCFAVMIRTWSAETIAKKKHSDHLDSTRRRPDLVKYEAEKSRRLEILIAGRCDKEIEPWTVTVESSRHFLSSTARPLPKSWASTCGTITLHRCSRRFAWRCCSARAFG